MVLYRANTSPRDLETVSRERALYDYPKYWELMKWYRCWRKRPYEAEIFAVIIAETRREAYSHYLCPLDDSHWHVGRGGNRADPKHLNQRAKRAYRKAVRDEIYAEYLEKQRVVQAEDRDA